MDCLLLDSPACRVIGTVDGSGDGIATRDWLIPETIVPYACSARFRLDLGQQKGSASQVTPGVSIKWIKPLCVSRGSFSPIPLFSYFMTMAAPQILLSRTQAPETWQLLPSIPSSKDLKVSAPRQGSVLKVGNLQYHGGLSLPSRQSRFSVSTVDSELFPELLSWSAIMEAQAGIAPPMLKRFPSDVSELTMEVISETKENENDVVLDDETSSDAPTIKAKHHHYVSRRINDLLDPTSIAFGFDVSCLAGLDDGLLFSPQRAFADACWSDAVDRPSRHAVVSVHSTVDTAYALQRPRRRPSTPPFVFSDSSESDYESDDCKTVDDPHPISSPAIRTHDGVTCIGDYQPLVSFAMILPSLVLLPLHYGHCPRFCRIVTLLTGLSIGTSAPFFRLDIFFLHAYRGPAYHFLLGKPHRQGFPHASASPAPPGYAPTHCDILCETAVQSAVREITIRCLTQYVLLARKAMLQLIVFASLRSFPSLPSPTVVYLPLKLFSLVAHLPQRSFFLIFPLFNRPRRFSGPSISRSFPMSRYLRHSFCITTDSLMSINISEREG